MARRHLSAYEQQSRRNAKFEKSFLNFFENTLFVAIAAFAQLFVRLISTIIAFPKKIFHPASSKQSLDSEAMFHEEALSSPCSNQSPQTPSSTYASPAPSAAIAERYCPNPTWEAKNITVRSKTDAEFVAPQCLKQVKDSLKIVNTTTNPQTFFERYDFLIGRFKILTECSRYIKFSGEQPNQVLDRLTRMDYYQQAVDTLIDRCYKKYYDKILSLKTAKGKLHAVDQFNEDFRPVAFSMNDKMQSCQTDRAQQLSKLAEEGTLSSPKKTLENVPCKPTSEFEKLYDLTSVDGILSIPLHVTKIASDNGSDVTNSPEQILSVKATEYKKAGKMDLAIACLRKANELRSPSFYAYTRNDYERLVDFLVEAGQFDEARAEHRQLDQSLGTREAELRSLQQTTCSTYADHQLYEVNVIMPELQKAKTREQYYWLLENMPQLAPKSFAGFSRMKNQNTEKYQKICEEAVARGFDFNSVSFWD